MRFFPILFLLTLTATLRAQAPQHVSEPPQIIEGPQAAGAQPAQQAQPASAPALMSNDTVVRMHEAGLSDDLVVQTINTQPGRYDTDPETLIKLRQAGISNEILSAMAGRARRPLGKPTFAPTAPRSDPPPDPAPIAISPVNEIGVYYKDTHGTWVPMESEIVHIQSGGFLKSTLTHGIVKEDHNGVVTGTQAKLVLPRPVEFLFYTPDGVDASEYELIRFRLNSKNREFRVLTGGIIHSTGGAQRDDVQIHPVKTAPRTWTFAIPADIPGAEYGILPPGTGNVTNGGKIYTFAIVEPK